MATIVNLNLAQQIQLESIFKDYKLSNPKIEFEFFNQLRPVQKEMFVFPEEIKKSLREEKTYSPESIENLEKKVDALASKLDLIFGNHILIDGKMVSVDNLKT